MQQSITQRPTFKRAQKSASFLRMGLAGPSGSGKTYTSLLLASYLAGDRGIAVIDTERGSASKYSDIFTFDVLELDNFHPDHYIEAIRAAQDAGYGALVIDSLSHAWNGTGGLLELHENVVRRQKTTNSYTAWAEITPIQNRLVNAITSARMHIIATMRSKTEYTIGENKKVEKVGMAPIQRDGMEYEFDVFAEMATDNTLLVQKSRCSALAGATIAKPGKGVADTLSSWLRGADGSETPAPAAAPIAPVVVEETPAPTAKAESVQKRTQSETHSWVDCRKLSDRLGYDEVTYRAGAKKYNKPDMGGAEAMYQALLKQLNARKDVITDPDEDVAAARAAGELPEQMVESQEMTQDEEDVAEMEAGWLPEDGSAPSNDYEPDPEQEHGGALAAMQRAAMDAGVSAGTWEDIVVAANGDLGNVRTLLDKYKRIPDLRKTVAGSMKGRS